MRYSIVAFAFIISLLAVGAAFADCPPGMQAATLCVPSGTGAGMSQCPPGMQGGVQALTTDDRFIYVVQNNQLYKFSKSDLTLMGVTPLTNLNMYGRGPSESKKSVIYPSGSEVDKYSPSGDTDTRVYGFEQPNY